MYVLGLPLYRALSDSPLPERLAQDAGAQTEGA
jgi:hypothetical protein